MNKRTPLLPLLVLAGGLYAAGCQKTDATAPSNASPVSSNTVMPGNASAAAAPTSTTAPDANTAPTAGATPLRDALTALFERENNTASSAFPKGTRLLNVDLKDKTALVDVSKEFNELQNKGESNEGHVQKELCAALARFPNVDTLHLTVEGKDYESQAADWRSIPVRVASDSASSGLQTAGSVDR